jgi:hypothetical protein
MAVGLAKTCHVRGKNSLQTLPNRPPLRRVQQRRSRHPPLSTEYPAWLNVVVAVAVSHRTGGTSTRPRVQQRCNRKSFAEAPCGIRASRCSCMPAVRGPSERVVAATAVRVGDPRASMRQKPTCGLAAGPSGVPRASGWLALVAAATGSGEVTAGAPSWCSGAARQTDRQRLASSGGRRRVEACRQLGGRPCFARVACVRKR